MGLLWGTLQKSLEIEIPEYSLMILLSHPTANQFSRNLLDALVEKNQLHSFHTTIAWETSSFLHNIVPKNIGNELARRSFDSSIQQKTISHSLYEWGRLISGKLKMHVLTKHEVGLFSLDRVYHELDKAVAKTIKYSSNLQGVYAYEDGALRTFQSAKRLGMNCYYDLPIAYWEFAKQLYLDEANRHPDWSTTLVGNRDSIEKCERKTEEMNLADKVIVPSSFVADSIPEHFKEKKQIIVAPFGSPTNRYFRIREKVEGKLKVLFVGSMSQRKGLADLFTAIKYLDSDKVELHILGTTGMDMNFYREEYPHFIYHPTRPHDEVLKIMAGADVFVLPSIVEGRAQVIQEAMSQGLPIIITPNTGGSDLVEDEKTGFLVPIRSPETIAKKIEWFVNNQNEIPSMRHHTKEKAKAVSWKKYQDTVLNALS